MRQNLNQISFCSASGMESIGGGVDEALLDAELSHVAPMSGGVSSALCETEEAIELMFRERDEHEDAQQVSQGISEDVDQLVSQSQGPDGHASPLDRPQQLESTVSRDDPAPELPALPDAVPFEAPLPPGRVPSNVDDDPSSHEDNDAIWDDLADYLKDNQDDQVIYAS